MSSSTPPKSTFAKTAPGREKVEDFSMAQISECSPGLSSLVRDGRPEDLIPTADFPLLAKSDARNRQSELHPAYGSHKRVFD